MTVGSQMPELDWGAFLPPPPYKIGCQNTPYKLGLTLTIKFHQFKMCQLAVTDQARIQTDSKDAIESVKISRNEYIQLNSNYIVMNIIC